MSLLKQLATNPTLRNYAQDTAQRSIRLVASFLAPTVEVPSKQGFFKKYDAKARYRPVKTRRGPTDRAVMIGFSADDGKYNLEGNAIDFPVPIEAAMDSTLALNQAQYGGTLIADASAISHEAEVVDKALAAVGAGTDVNIAAANFDLIKYLDERILVVMKLARNGAPVRLLFGANAWLLIKNHASVKAQFKGGSGKKDSVPTMEEFSAMLLGNPRIEVGFLVRDKAPDGADADIDFMLTNQVIIFACSETPNTMDPSFMKTFRLMGQWMVPGSYERDDGRVEVLKMDWHEEIQVTNAPAAERHNLNLS